MQLIPQRAANLLSIQNQIRRNTGSSFICDGIQKMSLDQVHQRVGNADVVQAV